MIINPPANKADIKSQPLWQPDPGLSQAETLEQYRIALDNAESQAEIAALMTELGFDSAVIAEGKAILTENKTSLRPKQNRRR